MWKCRDEKISYLRKFGYNVISLPRAGIRPLTVAFLHGSGRLTELGYLPEIWTAKEPAPQPIAGEDVSKIGGQSTTKLEASVGLDILANLVQALGANPIGVKAQYEKAKTFEFTFKEVERERITAFALGKYLIKGTMSSCDPFVKRYFQPTEKVYVVTEVLKSSGFGVTATDSSNAGLDVKVPMIEQALSGQVAIKVQKKSTGTVEFTGDKKLPFAFIAAQLVWTKDRWEVVEFPDPGEIHLAVSEPPAGKGDAFAQAWKGGAVLFGEGGVEIGERPKTDD
jgi:hypothetical protein